MQELERTGREIKGTGHQCPLQVLRFYPVSYTHLTLPTSDLFSKNGLEFSGSKVDRAFSFSKLDRHFGQAQQRHTTLMSGLKAAAGSFRAAFAGLFGGGAPSPQREAVEEAEAMAQDRCRSAAPGRFRCRHSTLHLLFHSK